MNGGNIMNEFKRILNKRIIIVIVLLFVINALLLISGNEKNREEAMVYNELLSMTKETKSAENSYYDASIIAWKQYMEKHQINKDTITDDIKNARTLISEKAKYADGYKATIEEKIKYSVAAMNSGFYEEQSFENINLYKTYGDWQNILDAEVTISNGRWLETLYEYKYNHIFVLIAVIIVVYGFFSERKNGLYYIIHTGKCGRLKLYLKRCGILLVSSMAVSFLFHIESAFILLKIYGGFEDIDLSALCDEMFLLTSRNMSRLQFLFVVVAFSGMAAFVMAMLLWWILSMFNNPNIGIVIYLLTIAVNMIVYAVIPAKSGIRVLKYINLYYFLYPNKALGYYNWGYDFGLWEVLESTIILAVVVGAFTFAINLYTTVKHYFTGKSNFIERGINCIMDKIGSAFGKTPMFIKELYKILISQKVIVVLAVLIYIVANINIGNRIMYTAEMIYVSEYYDEAHGISDSNELNKILKQHEIEYEKLLSTLDMNDDSDKAIADNRLQVLESIRANVEYVNLMNNKGIKATALKPYDYEVAFGQMQGENQRLLALVNILAAIAISAGIISYEKGCNVNTLANTYFKRRKWLVRKIGANVALIAMFELITYGIYYYKLFKLYDVTGLDLPLKSLSLFKDYIINSSIIGFIIIDLCIKLVVLVALSSIICVVSKYIKTLYSMLVGMVVVIPQMLYMIGFETLDKLSIGRYIAFLPVFNDVTQPMNQYYIFLIVTLVIGMALYVGLIKKGTSK